MTIRKNNSEARTFRYELLINQIFYEMQPTDDELKAIHRFLATAKKVQDAERERREKELKRMETAIYGTNKSENNICADTKKTD